MKTPVELKYSRDHEWVKIEGTRARVGITDYAQSQLGDVVFVEVPTVDSKIAVGASFSVVESVKAVSDIYAPIGGVIVEVNETLTDAPEIMNEDPYGEGWLVVIEIADPADLNQLLSSDEYEKLIAEGGH
ncbi:glycine cleavage system protein GcvH [Pelosinus sp. UFO1]|uniref:glycine cleavage system protein GcvH n=1 Tax=Pelosinus sp. UFO1 TaxID=484770 RepID=UPI0004D0DEE7|nr:glycine cleavage system protein GcvH [Pelosinus sp. UFO1]AIF51547.1 Glycine cleavage system H protein [Pelosinus sp. UFO1]